MDFHPDTVPTTEQIRDTLADRIYHPYKKLIWTAGAILAAVVIGFLAVRESERSHRNEQWDRFNLATSTAPLRDQAGQVDAGAAQKRVNALDTILRDFPEGEIVPWALKAKAETQYAARDFDAALATLGQLRKSHPDFAFLRVGAGDGQKSLADRLEALITKEKSWTERTRYEHVYPPDDAPRFALVETSVGSFKIGFYEDASPEHVAAFVRRAKAGGFNGTQVYEVRRDTDGTAQLFAAGSDESKTETDPSLHDRDDPTDTIEPEDGRFKIRHYYRTVSSVVTRSGESGSRFMVITNKKGMRSFDSENTPFGAVLDRDGGLEVIDKIGLADTYDTHPKTSPSREVFRVRDHPYPYILIDRVTIWTDEKLEDGHTWDTRYAESGDPDPSPLRPEPWLPEDLGKKDGDPENGDPKDGDPKDGGGDDEGGEKKDDKTSDDEAKDGEAKDGEAKDDGAKKDEVPPPPPPGDEPK